MTPTVAFCRHCQSEISSPAVQSISRTGSRTGPGVPLFCCAGCEAVHGILEKHGLTSFYQLRDANPPICAVPMQVAIEDMHRDYRAYDEPGFLKAASSDGNRVRFFLEGMSCSACVWLLEKLPDFCTDVISARVNMAASTIEVVRRPGGSFSFIATTLNQLGYKPHALKTDESTIRLQTRERRYDLIRIGISAALTGNIMIMAVSLYGGATGELAWLFQIVAACLSVPVLSYGAWPFYRSALASLRLRRLNIDVPIALAILVGVLTSVVSLARGGTDLYFDSLSMLVFLLLSSRFLLKSIQDTNLQATHLEDDLLVGTVEKEVRSGVWAETSASVLQIGDRVKIQVGSLVPIDGLVDSGFAKVNAAVLTGESANLNVSVGDVVEAGCRYVSGDSVLRVLKTPRQTRLAGILKETERLAETKSKFVHLSDLGAQYFIAIVFMLATGVVLFFFKANPAEGISRALALIIVTCPCVFGIAIPLSMAMAIRKAARRGVIIKSADAIEKLWSAQKVFFDKTATLTTGKMTVVRSCYSKQSDLGILRGLEQDQLHPIAQSLTRYATTEGAAAVQFQSIEKLATGGVSGFIDGFTYKVRPLPGSGINANFGLFQNERIIADFEVGDEIRPETFRVLTWLRKAGLETHILSGDRKPIVDQCAAKLGFSQTETRAQMTPEEKAKVIIASGSNSVMIGDGANDASAFAAASVGIAVHGSLDVSLRAADMYLTQPNLESIPALFQIARSAKSAIYRNLAFSASFNIAAGALAIMGEMTPLWAAVLMPLSSLTVLLSALFSSRQFQTLEART